MPKINDRSVILPVKRHTHSCKGEEYSELARRVIRSDTALRTTQVQSSAQTPEEGVDLAELQIWVILV